MRPLPIVLLPLLASSCGEREPAGPPAPGVAVELPADVRAGIEAALAQVRAAPEEGVAWRELGEQYEANSLLPLAEECYERAAELAPEDSRGWYHLARLRGDRGAPEGALEAAAQALESAPTYGPIHWRVGGWWLELGRLDEAQAAFARALEVDPRNPAGRWGLARVALERGEAAAALAALAPLAGTQPDFAYTHHLRASALRGLARGDEAAAEAARGGQPVWIDPWKADVEDRRGGFHGKLARVRAAVAARDLDAATRLLEEMHALEPDNVNVIGMLSDVLLSNGRAADAEALLLAARERAPDHYRHAINLALVYEKTGDPERALAALDDCLRLHPTFGLAHLRRGRILSRGAGAAAALEALEEARRVGETGAELERWCGRAYADLGRWSESARALEAAFDAQPAVPLAMMAAEAHARAGEREAAWSAYGRARALAPDDERLSGLGDLIAALVGEPAETSR